MVWIKVTINNCCSDDSNRSTRTAATTDRTRRIRLQLSKLLGGRYLSGVRQFVVIYATATTDGGRSVAKRQIHLSSLWANDHVKARVYNWDIRLSANSGLWRVRFANCTRFDESMHGHGRKISRFSFLWLRASNFTVWLGLDISLGAKCWKSFYKTAFFRRFVFSFRFM